MRGLGPKQQKVLLLLLTLGAVSFAGTPRSYFRALKVAGRAWREITDRNTNQVIRQLYRSKLIDIRELPDGTTVMKLTEQGKMRVLYAKYDTLEIPKPPRWDKKWRVVLFDIPEEQRRDRAVLRDKLVRLGFRELQKSVLVYPYPCRDQLDFLIEYFGLRRYVRTLEASDIDVATHLKKHFHL